MPSDHNQQHSRRPHYHRGRRGADRRSGDRRPQTSQPEPPGREQLDIEQIMREIRSRIAERHGIDLTNQQIQELAARRLEAILDPRAIKPSLMDELRRAAGIADAPRPEPEGGDAFEEPALYETRNGLLRVLRRLFNPLLKLLINPGAITEALQSQSRRLNAAAEREADQRRRQAEWNALHFEILRRLVTDIARVEIENQHLALRVESLSARVDFNERRVRAFEQAQHQWRPTARTVDAPTTPPPASAPRTDVPALEQATTETSADAGRRRRRRRRGRRGAQRELTGIAVSESGSAEPVPEQMGDGGDLFDEGGAEDLEGSGEPALTAESVVDSGFEATPEERPHEDRHEPAPTASTPSDAGAGEPAAEPAEPEHPITREHS